MNNAERRRARNVERDRNERKGCAAWKKRSSVTTAASDVDSLSLSLVHSLVPAHSFSRSRAVKERFKAETDPRGLVP